VVYGIDRTTKVDESIKKKNSEGGIHKKNSGLWSLHLLHVLRINLTKAVQAVKHVARWAAFLALKLNEFKNL